MTVRADATLLNGSNITYVMKNDISQLSTKVDENMVTFTDFNHHQSGHTVLVTGKGSSATSILVNINVEKGAIINAYLSEDGQNRATIDGSGRLKYTLDLAGKDNLIGTYTIESGNLRYTPPLLSQKSFDIISGSSMTWTGDMLNPQLDLKGIERLKASATTDEKGTHPVEFVINAHVGGTLNGIDLKFDLDCESDMQVRNELQAMSDNQRSQAAINLLLYNTYSGTRSEGNISQYEGKAKGTETSYSYRLAKTLFNDRFKIVVGGEYNTDAANEEKIASNLFNDISLEYYLNSSGNRYLKLFRQVRYESMLEDQVTETGVAYVLKRKLTDLRNLFKFKHSKEYLLRDSLEKARRAEYKLIEENRKAELELQEKAIDAISRDNEETVKPDDAIDRPTVNRKKDDESEP